MKDNVRALLGTEVRELLWNGGETVPSDRRRHPSALALLLLGGPAVTTPRLPPYTPAR